jgi:hypothetical protein
VSSKRDRWARILEMKLAPNGITSIRVSCGRIYDMIAARNEYSTTFEKHRLIPKHCISDLSKHAGLRG